MPSAFFFMILLSTVYILILAVALVFISQIKKEQQRTQEIVKSEIAKNREESSLLQRQSREEVVGSVKNFNDSLISRFVELTQLNEQKLERLRQSVEDKLEQTRLTVDEKLHETLERRLGESFMQVSERLELVHKGLGEMQSLASGVGDLKKVLTNVKTLGIVGEVQLGNLLEQILTPEQYERNVATKMKSQDRVEFAIRLPGRGSSADYVWLPIDAKFPAEQFEQLVHASEQGDIQLVEDATREFIARIKEEAKSIREKYVDPPHTTDFAILFLPVESIFAEVLRVPGFLQELQSKYQVMVTGPTTLAAILNSLQMGFKTLAIEKRTSEVWELLGAVKTNFSKFGDILEKTQKKLEEATSTIEDAAKKSRTIEKKLKGVQTLSRSKARELLATVEESEELPSIHTQLRPIPEELRH